MANNMPVVVEVWPMAADEFGIWLISGSDGWRSPPIQSDSEPHDEAVLRIGLRPILLHSTSWRMDGQVLVLTYIAAIHCPTEWVRDNWHALPVSPDLIDEVGNPLVHGAGMPPAPRYVDVLHHGLRHLRFLLDTDMTAREALAGYWTTHLNEMTPALAGMYE